MATRETFDTALSWYQTGVDKLYHSSVSLGISYLDKAIAVFQGEDDLRLLTLARHYRLLGLKLEERHDEVEREFASVMHGYTQIDIPYGQGLLLIHLAECQAAQGRWERANSYFNLASVIAENYRLAALQIHVGVLQARLYRQRGNHVHAVQALQRAERYVLDGEGIMTLAKLRHERGEMLFEMGELSEATVLLEDAQGMWFRAERPQDALKPLTLLKRVYQNAGMNEELERVTGLIHICGQKVISRDDLRREPDEFGPPIDPGA